MASSTMANVGFHEYKDAVITQVVWAPYYKESEFTYSFENFFHPFVGELIEKLNKESLSAMLDPTFQGDLKDEFFGEAYSIQSRINHSPKGIDLLEGGSYSNYNWELFYHIPLMIAVHLSKNQRFAEAQRWFHYIFDPTCNDMSIEPPARFWKFLRFREGGGITQIDELLALLSKPDNECTQLERDLKVQILDGYEALKERPFRPHAVARTRQVAYQYCVVMKYLDNLVAWGDSLFRQDSVESINEATQRYVLAANLLGTRPEVIPARGTVGSKTFAQLKAQGLDAMGNALVELEATFPFNLARPETLTAGGESQTGTLFGIGRTLYFCIPRNDTMLGYWDLVADRLFKIRHCMNIEGLVRPLALFDPPLDPGMLIKAVAAGIDIGSIVNGLNIPIGPVRSVAMIQKALELSSEVRNLGNALLSALEKGDGEHLGLIRERHEIQIQQMAQDVRFLQWKSAQEATTSLLASRAPALERFRYYQRLLGLPSDQNAWDSLALDRRELTEENFDEAYGDLAGQYDKQISPQKFPSLRIAGDASPAQQSGASGQGRLYLNQNEDAELNSHLPTARDTSHASSISDTIASGLTMIPDFDVDLHFWGLGLHSTVFGGVKLSDASKIAAQILRTTSIWEQAQAGIAARTAGHERRADDWLLQYNLAAHELRQNGRQILTSLIAEQIARREYVNTKQQIDKAQEVDQFLHEKYTNEELYLWMKGEISRLYYEYYRLAFDTARKAERTMKQELMRPELDAQDFVKFNYWDGGRKGLLSGEALHLDLKRMETAYNDHNKRELELTRHVSMRQLNPLALLALKATGSCTVTVPEWLYDRDCPGHYLRRIKSVALSIPSVVGPYTSINCTLSLLKSSLRKSPLPKDGEYARQGSEDDRFIDYIGAVQSIVTSGASNDSGMFETNLREDRFLPFEGAGAESTWKLDLPKPEDHPAFDYATISDVILHIRYTARQGVDATRVRASLDDLFQQSDQANLALLFSLRHDFPSEWSKFVTGTSDFAATIRQDYFPYFTQRKSITINGLELYASDVKKHHEIGAPKVATVSLDEKKEFDVVAAADGPGPTQVLVRSSGAQVFLIVRYSLD